MGFMISNKVLFKFMIINIRTNKILDKLSYIVYHTSYVK